MQQILYKNIINAQAGIKSGQAVLKILTDKGEEYIAYDVSFFPEGLHFIEYKDINGSDAQEPDYPYDEEGY